ncbi:unnamed protein product [Acanthoscelides obtectus]|uniref:Uncharacterized protein n=1 Tax=Acanthoscelides obtectus TaxID=200917 RepID=A0A9P0JR29_ACAOB|nr:unnamed protein product [Acanthoscelides obtectus]CAK1667943.1 hypothetical protein AOBTE_LOCUS26128 [Acanthoscelides obtectus]
MYQKALIYVEPAKGSKFITEVSTVRNYVNCNYNLAFGTPLTDACSTCLRAEDSIAKATFPEEKTKLLIEHRVHVLKTKAFYGMLKNDQEDVEICTFDCQKNLPLPKLPDQSAYLCQQINLYNFTVVCDMRPKKMKIENSLKGDKSLEFYKIIDKNATEAQNRTDPDEEYETEEEEPVLKI